MNTFNITSMELNPDNLTSILNKSSMLTIYYPLLHSDVWLQVYEFSTYLVAFPQALLNTGVILVLSLAATVCQQRLSNGLLFLLNLAVSDFLHAIIIFVNFYKFHNQNYDREDPAKFAEMSTDGCRWKSVAMSFIYMQSMMATIILTMDRYLAIAYWNREVMTRRRALVCIVLCWVAPTAISVATAIFFGSGTQVTL